MRDRRGNAMAILQVGFVPVPFSILCRGTRSHGASRAAKTRRHILALVALALTIASPVPARATGPEGQLTWGVHVSLAPTWFDPAEMSGIITPYMVYYALHDALGEAHAGQAVRAEPCQVMDRFRRRPGLRVHPARRREIPQRRARDGRGREVLVREVSRRVEQGAEGPRRSGRDPRSPARPLQAQAALAGLS